jgi:hypothetical protein
MSADGMPHSPKPPAAMLAPDGMSATAVAGSRSTLSITTHLRERER